MVEAETTEAQAAMPKPLEPKPRRWKRKASTPAPTGRKACWREGEKPDAEARRGICPSATVATPGRAAPEIAAGPIQGRGSNAEAAEEKRKRAKRRRSEGLEALTGPCSNAGLDEPRAPSQAVPRNRARGWKGSQGLTALAPRPGSAKRNAATRKAKSAKAPEALMRRTPKLR